MRDNTSVPCAESLTSFPHLVVRVGSPREGRRVGCAMSWLRPEARLQKAKYLLVNAWVFVLV
jgi:hypothetical protein